MPTEQKPLMIRGDRLLLALDVLAFLVKAWRDVSAWGKIPKEIAQRLTDPKVNLRCFSWKKTVGVMRPFSPFMANHPGDSIELVYEYSNLDPVDAPMNVIHDFLLCAHGIETATFDAEFLIDMSGGNWFNMEDGNPINKPLRSFFRVIASGELTEADFRE